MIVICQCGKTIVAKRTTRKYCDSCIRIRKKYCQDKYDKRIRRSRFCQKCNLDITGTSCHKYCPQCSKIARQERIDRHNQKLIAKAKAQKPTTYKCIDCKDIFPVITRKVQRCPACTDAHLKKKARERQIERDRADSHTLINKISTVNLDQEYEIKLCANCNKNPIFGLKKYCDDCKILKRKESAKKYKSKTRKRKPPKTYQCIDCKCQIISYGSNTLRCASCRKEYSKTYHRERARIIRSNKLLPKETFINCPCGARIVKKSASHIYCKSCAQERRNHARNNRLRKSSEETKETPSNRQRMDL